MPRFRTEGNERNPRELAEQGYYPLRCTGVEDKTSRNGDPMWSLKWEIVGGPHGGSWVWDIIMFAGKAAGWHKQKLKVIYGDDFDEDADFETDDMMFREAWGWVAHNTYNGKTSLKIDSSAGADACGYAHRSASEWRDAKVPGQDESGDESHEGDEIPF